MKKFILSLGFLTAAAAACLSRASEFDVRNEAEFRKIVSADARVETLGGGMRFVEGPVWIKRDGGYLVFSDIPANELKKWTRAEGITTFRNPSNNANGNTLDREGRLVTAEHGARRISRTSKDGAVITLAEQFQGNRLNSPNDAVVKSDGTIWFTDPDYGLAGRKKELEWNGVYRFDPEQGLLRVLVKDFDKPNGLCFSPDEKHLYVADSGAPRHIRVFDVENGGTLSNGRVFCAIDKGGPDGIRCDAEGRVFSSAGDGVQIFAPDGSLIGKILTAEAPANLCFGGPEHKTLFITARKSLYAIELLVKGDLSSR